MNSFTKPIYSTLIATFLIVGVLSPRIRAEQSEKSPVKVYILVGQSNMEGKGTITHLEMVVSEKPKLYGALKSKGKWVERGDVWIDYLGNGGKRKKGKLTVGYGSPEDRIGPELGFGCLIGDKIKETALIIKYAVGGRAIAMEFRPPSSGAIDPNSIPEKMQKEIESGKRKPGDEYRKMMAHIKDVLGNIKGSVPGYDGGAVELGGFVWFQGWNDQYNGFENHYQANMANFIRDVRKELKSPKLPFVIGGMGQGGKKPMYKSAIIRKAQKATAEMEEFKKNNVRYVPTAPYWIEGKQGDGGYHYNGNAEIFLLIGKAFGKAVLEMQGISTEEISPKKSPGPKKTKAVKAVRFDPVVKQIEGWTVHVDPAMLEGPHSEAGAKALKMLANHLQRIAILLPAEQLAKMRKLEIWIEHHHPTLGAMQFHPSVGWLKSHGHDPRLAKKVHITRAKTLLSRQQMIKHPAVVLHELAHAYHDRYYGFDDKRILDAYKKAKDAGIYEKVLLYTGRKVRHYALTDQMEYFAEGTEAYFYRNDFYPFCRAELKEHDPVLHDLLEDIWGTL